MLRPRWLATHAVLVVICVTMVLLGRWQWDVAGSGGSGEGSLLNYGYAVQWWLFTLFAVFFWVRLLRDGRRRQFGLPPLSSAKASKSDRVLAPNSAGYRLYAMPQAAQIRETDPEMAAYNAYLASLNPAATGHPAAGGDGER